MVREALAAGEVVRWPILAWIAGVDPQAILWGPAVWVVLVVANVVGDAGATRHAIEMALDVAAPHRELELAVSGLPGGG